MEAFKYITVYLILGIAVANIDITVRIIINFPIYLI